MVKQTEKWKQKKQTLPTMSHWSLRRPIIVLQSALTMFEKGLGFWNWHNRTWFNPRLISSHNHQTTDGQIDPSIDRSMHVVGVVEKFLQYSCMLTHYRKVELVKLFSMDQLVWGKSDAGIALVIFVIWSNSLKSSISCGSIVLPLYLSYL